VAVLVAAIDLLSKAWAHRYVPAGLGSSSSSGLVQLRWITNREAALGLGAGHPLVVAGVAVLSTVAIGWWLSRTVSGGECFAVAVVLGGALGNLGDRLAHGAVTDWVHVAGYPATFNVADVCIRVGIILALAFRALRTRSTRGAT
jgi:signal peptidase II